MGKWFRLDQLRKLTKFIGLRSLIYLGAGAGTGIALFLLEIVFAYVLQAFLVVFDIMPSGVGTIPSWLPTESRLTFLLFVSTAVLIRGFAQWCNSFLTAAAFEVQRDTQRYRLVEWGLRSPLASAGKLMSQFNEGTNAAGMVSSSLQGLCVLSFTSSLLLVALGRISLNITLIGIGAMALIGFGMRALDRKLNAQGKQLAVDVEQLNTRLMNSIKNLLLLQIYGTQVRERGLIKARLDSSLSAVLSYQRSIYLKTAIPQALGTVVVCCLGAVSVKNGWIVPGLMITYFYLFLRLVQNVAEALRMGSTISFFLPGAISLAQWWALHSHDGIANPVAQGATEETVPLGGPIAWRVTGIVFSYPESIDVLFEGLSFEVGPGRALVVTGESGSGKSTLISLLLGSAPPSKGRIEISDESGAWQPVHNLRSRLLQSIGYVGPESFLIEGTILENVVYGLTHAPMDAEVRSALAKAECGFVDELPAGLGHRLTEQGQGLSAGQKQRLSLARALLRKPKALILDEATANLDVETEKRLIQTFESLKGTTTLVIVTHRESLLAIADQHIHIR